MADQVRESSQGKTMPEAEVTLRLAHHLVGSGLSPGPVNVSIDGAQVQLGERRVFEIEGFLKSLGWRKERADPGWWGDYRHPEHEAQIRIDSKSGQGDVSAPLCGGGRVLVECKKGPLVRSKSSVEYPLLREALGQALTVPSVEETDLIGVAVPASDRFRELAGRWLEAPLVRRSGIFILTVDREGGVEGFPEALVGSDRRMPVGDSPDLLI